MNDRQLKMYMTMALAASTASTATRLKVGAIAVLDHRVISDGYNGTAPGSDNRCEGDDGLTLPSVIHAESNLIFKLARDGQPSKGASLFITHSPCEGCANAIRAAGFKEVFYLDDYRSDAGIVALRRGNVPVTKLIRGTHV